MADAAQTQPSDLQNIMEYRNFFEDLKFINIVNIFCEDKLLYCLIKQYIIRVISVVI